MIFFFQLFNFNKKRAISKMGSVKKVEICTKTVATQPRQLHYSNNLSKKKRFFFWGGAGLPAGSGGLASQGDQPKKGEKNFFFAPSGFPPGFGVSEIGGDHQKDPPKFFFSPQ